MTYFVNGEIASRSFDKPKQNRSIWNKNVAFYWKMKALYFIAFAALAAYFVEAFAPNPIPRLGAKQCTWGPTYWCSNLTAAAGCHAVRHCIQTVWEHQQLPPDTDTVCQTCIKMVTEARDQLESNETQEEIKEVFEGSCKLIPIKLVSKECCKLADDFIPELVDTLASQMNPQIVCSVAGLCNSERVDKLIANYEKRKSDDAIDTCDGCHTVVGILQTRFEKMSKDEVLQSLLQICGRMASLSDSCSNIVVTYFKEIYDHLQANFNANDVCLLTGECAAQFHTHVEITPLSKVGFVPVASRESDDLPCELCEQLVNHLRDVLVANTTEMEFKQVLEGLCKQTRQFKNECLSIVDEYYAMIYDFLTSHLNSTVACSAAGLCPGSIEAKISLPTAPILPIKTAPKLLEISTKKPSLGRVGIGNDGSSAIQIVPRPENMQLPIERIFPPHAQQTYSDQLCLFCEYFLHYLQQAITDPKTEDEIKQIVDEGCEKLPSSVHDTCIAFVNDYGSAVVALLAQEIDPSTICPLIKLCPSSDAGNVEVFMEQKGDSKCPLCLFAVSQLEEMIENEKTEIKIKKALHSLCMRLPNHLNDECQSFVDEYSERIIEMLLADLNAQEVCVYLRLCQDKMPPKPLELPTSSQEDMQILTNEISDYTSNGEFIVPIKGKPKNNNPECVICEFAMQKLQKILENKTTEEEIKDAVLNICHHLPKTVQSECTSFVDQYANLVIQLLISSIEPDQICAYLKLCDKKSTTPNLKIIDLDGISVPAEVISQPKNDVKSPQCSLCKLITKQLEKLFMKNMTKDEIKDALFKICGTLPKSYEMSCDDFMHKHADTIADLILDAVLPEEICSMLMLCDFQKMKDEISSCVVCKIAYHTCNDLQHEQKLVTVDNVCNEFKSEQRQKCEDMLRDPAFKFHVANETGAPKTCNLLYNCGFTTDSHRYRRQSGEQVLIGGNRCTWGPSYWCSNLENAQSCGEGALSHCRERVWKAQSPSK